MAVSRLCSIPDCGKRHYGQGYCSAHYERWKRHGDAQAGRVANGKALSFLRQFVLPFSGDNCLLWPYCLDGKGYGRIRLNGRMMPVHRLSCEHANGRAPTPRHEAAHNCGERRCVNPRHIRWATTIENNADKIAHGRENRGTRNGMSTCSEDQVRAIKAMLKTGEYSQRQIANNFGLSQQHVSDIHNGERWGWLT